LPYDQLIAKAAAQEYVPLVIDKRWLWISRADRDTWADSGGAHSAPPAEKPRHHPSNAPDRELDRECSYGKDSGYRATAEPFALDVSSFAGITRSRVTAVPPLRAAVRKGYCGAAVVNAEVRQPISPTEWQAAPMCDAPNARLFPCGWRCDQHQPTTGSDR
jgi:hypothetical protein